MKNHNSYTHEMIEFTILEDYIKDKSTGKKMKEIEPGKTELIKTFKEVKHNGIKSKIMIYNSDIARVRELMNSKLKPYKDRCLIKLRDNDVFVVKGDYKTTLSLVFKNFKNNKIGF